MTAPCAGCGADQAHDPAVICRRCTRRLDADLHVIPTLLRLLDDTLTRSDRLNRPTGPATPDPDAGLPLTAAVTALPFAGPAGDAAKNLRMLAALWAAALHDWRTPDAPPAPVDDRAVPYLAARVELLRHHPAAGDASTEIGRACARGWSLIDRPADTWWAGYCDAPVDDPAVPGTVVACGWELRAPLGAPAITCRGCGTVHDVADRRHRLLEAARHQLVTATQAARALSGVDQPVTSSAVRGWVRLGYLKAQGVNAAGHARYLLGDVTDVHNRIRYGQTPGRTEAS